MYKERSFENGFRYIEIVNEVAYAKIALQGAHIFEYGVKKKSSLLWLSDQSSFKNGIAIRGGIPLCWPRFGNRDKSLPQHGFARVMQFELISVKESNLESTKVHLQLKSSSQTRAIWDHEFILDIVFCISKELSITMSTTNLGNKEFFLTQAFHTYFQVSDISDVTIFGLEEISFLDTLRDSSDVEENSLGISDEVDRVYEGNIKKILLKDKLKIVEIEAKNSASAIVWNPWVKKCSQMSGMQKDAYREFVCIESANTFDDFKVIMPDEIYEIGVTYKEV